MIGQPFAAAFNFKGPVTNDSRTNDSAASPFLLLGMVDSLRDNQPRHPMTGLSDAEKYRWIRSNQGNAAIADALAGCRKDADFDDRIAAEMAMCGGGMRSYRLGADRS